MIRLRNSRTVAVSSFSIWENLGGLRIPVGDEIGKPTEIILVRTPELTLEEFPAAARARLGVSSVEIYQIQILDSSDEGVARLKQALAEARVELLNVPIDVGYVAAQDRDERHVAMNQIRRWIDIAAKLDARFCRVRAMFPASSPAYAEAVDALRELGRYARGCGIRLLIENQGGVSAEPKSLVKLLDELGDEVGLLLDTGNFEPLMSWSNAQTAGDAASGEDLDLREVYAALAILAPYAELLHAKAHNFDSDGRHTPLDLRRALTVVAEQGFDGPITVEYEGMSGDRWDNTARSVATVLDVFPTHSVA